MRWGVLLQPSARGRAYLQMLLRELMIPDQVFVMGCPNDDHSLATPITYDDFDPNESLRCSLATHGMDYIEIEGRELSDPNLAQTVRAASLDLCIFSGGGILPPSALTSARRWIHVHPGRLPDWRGSTCHYYGLLLEGIVEVSAFYMESGLDAGEVLCAERFEPEADWREADLDHVLDARLRGRVLVKAMQKVLRDGLQRGRTQDEAGGQMFYVIHPVLKEIAVSNLGRACDFVSDSDPHPEATEELACPYC